MTTWIISANPKRYDVEKSFEDYPFIDWGQRANFQIGDVVFIYTSGKVGMIQHKCIIDAINLIHPNIRNDIDYYTDKRDYYNSLSGKFMRLTLQQYIDDIGLSYDNLKSHGLVSKIQGPLKKIEPSLLEYINSIFSVNERSQIFPEEIDKNDTLFEGIKKQILVNKYERSSTARQKCLNLHKPICTVCEMNFLNTYGEIGRDFIHIHHLIPIHKIGIKYKINYEKDLIPVCPNCHSMLHRKINGKEPEVNELREMISKQKS